MLDYREVRRYLGIKNGDGGVSDSLIEELFERAKRTVTPQIISGEYDIGCTHEGYLLAGTQLVFKGKLIEKVLDGCSGLVLFAATLTLEADKIVREYSAKDMGNALVINAVLTAYLENAADEFEVQIKAREAAKGNTAKPRISCGYGDFDLSAQKDIISLLKADKYLGISVNESNMLVPVKSITALIGIKANAREKETKEHCDSCNKDCGYRKDNNEIH